jgi:hypothetical protein
MPYLIRRPRIARIVTAFFGTALATVAIPAIASACTVGTSGSPVFGSLGDTANYSLAQSGSFEAGTSGWSLTNSSVISGNESFFVNSPGDSHALLITPNGSAVSAPICVGIATPTFRFVARKGNGSWAQMNVNLLWTDASGTSHSTTAGSVSGGSSWALSPVMNLGNSLPLWQADQTLTVRLQFLPAQYGGAWNIDDVYVDPYGRG